MLQGKMNDYMYSTLMTPSSSSRLPCLYVSTGLDIAVCNVISIGNWYYNFRIPGWYQDFVDFTHHNNYVYVCFFSNGPRTLTCCDFMSLVKKGTILL